MGTRTAHRRRRTVTRFVGTLVTGALVAGLGTGIATPQQAEAALPGDKDAIAELFEWKYDSVARECATTLAPAGYGYVEVSPPQEHIQGPQWWTSYQPVSYRIAGRLGDREAFKNMVDACHRAGVKVIADAVINHMSAGDGTGTGGSPYTKYDYPGHYSAGDFHYHPEECPNSDNTIHGSDYTGSKAAVQNCQLVGLADLETEEEHVRSEIAGYLNDLISLGVDGFRIDAAKHMPASDLAAIKAKLTKPDIFWAQEVIYRYGEAVLPDEYTGNGDVDEFRYAFTLKWLFQEAQLSYLSDFGASWGFLPSDKARVFVDNWDTEREGSTLTYKDGADYTLANVFMLAWPYGTPTVHSGYEFTDHDAGPPNGGTVETCYRDGWKCQHTWPKIRNMVGFHNAVKGTSVTNWWDNGNDAIAFGRGDKGYVAINHESGPITQTFTTSLPAGKYCDVQHGNPRKGGGCTGTAYTVGADGKFTATIAAGDAVALHAGALAARSR